MKYLDELKKLNLPKDKYAVFGSGPLAIRGLRENKDIDIIVKLDLWQRLKKKYPDKIKKTEDDKAESIYIGNIQILEVNYQDWSSFINDPDRLIDQAETIQGFPFVKLEHLLECKKIMNREKDWKDIELINGYLSKAPHGNS